MKIVFGPRKKRYGASLVEMILAIFVLTVVLLGLLGGITIARANLMAKERETAQQVALAVLEALEFVPYNDIKTQSADIFDEKEFGGFVIDVHAAVPVDEPKNRDAMIVSVDVWLNSSGGAERVTLAREVSASAWKNAGD